MVLSVLEIAGQKQQWDSGDPADSPPDSFPQAAAAFGVLLVGLLNF
jgi:hypothetical protein